MQRAPLLVISGAVAGFVGLIGLHTAASAPPASGQAAATGPAGRSTLPAAAGSAGSGTRNRQPARRGAGRQQSAGGGGGTVRTATGTSENFGYGTIAVRVTVRGNRIIAASVSALQTLEPTSQQISAQAVPVLRSEVLSAQSANIHGVSGATYTSQGYDQSLQAALATLHVS